MPGALTRPVSAAAIAVPAATASRSSAGDGIEAIGAAGAGGAGSDDRCAREAIARARPAATPRR